MLRSIVKQSGEYVESYVGLNWPEQVDQLSRVHIRLTELNWTEVRELELWTHAFQWDCSRQPN